MNVPFEPETFDHVFCCFVLEHLARPLEALDELKRVLVPELNMGQLRALLRERYLVDAIGLNKVQGKPFLISEIEKEINYHLDGELE